MELIMKVILIAIVSAIFIGVNLLAGFETTVCLIAGFLYIELLEIKEYI